MKLAAQHVKISTEDFKTIKHCGKSLFSRQQTMDEKYNNQLFDVTIGYYDG